VSLPNQISELQSRVATIATELEALIDFATDTESFVKLADTGAIKSAHEALQKRSHRSIREQVAPAVSDLERAVTSLAAVLRGLL